MWDGKYIKWNPIPEFESSRLYCEALHDDWEGFRIWFKPEDESKGMIIVAFESTLLYVNSDEGKRLAQVGNMAELNFPHAFWKVETAALVTLFKEQCAGIHNDDSIFHFAFLSCSDCIDVLALSEPEFRYD